MILLYREYTFFASTIAVHTKPDKKDQVNAVAYYKLSLCPEFLLYFCDLHYVAPTEWIFQRYLDSN